MTTDEDLAREYAESNTGIGYMSGLVNTTPELCLKMVRGMLTTAVRDGIAAGRHMERERINSALDTEDLDRADWSDDKKAGYALCRLGIIEAVLNE